MAVRVASTTGPIKCLLLRASSRQSSLSIVRASCLAGAPSYANITTTTLLQHDCGKASPSHTIRNFSLSASVRQDGRVRRCFKCDELGHMASQCPNPPVCYNCRKPGHVSSQCSEPTHCKRCGEEGHIMKDCPKPRECWACGQLGHTAAACPNRSRS